ncbi:MAG TPA: hypothetical protein VMA37_15535 [Acetobacteraceae bacterium]|nr:hypothetical protein [Acetobacteraceae bacterium]
MVAYSFKSEFVRPIVTGEKRQTIRAGRRRHVRPGEVMQLYYGMRTKACYLVGTAVCASIWPISIDVTNVLIEYADTRLKGRQALDDFARSDGFPDWSGMRNFWIENHGPHEGPWTGLLIRWHGFAAATADA